jgi:hypothetical protein
MFGTFLCRQAPQEQKTISYVVTSYSLITYYLMFFRLGKYRFQLVNIWFKAFFC